MSDTTIWGSILRIIYSLKDNNFDDLISCRFILILSLINLTYLVFEFVTTTSLYNPYKKKVLLMKEIQVQQYFLAWCKNPNTCKIVLFWWFENSWMHKSVSL